MAVPATGKNAEQMCIREDCGMLPLCRTLVADFVQGLEKVIPDAPKGDVPVHLRNRQIFADRVKVLYPGEKDVGVMNDTAKS